MSKAPAALDDEALLEKLFSRGDLLERDTVDEILRRTRLAPRLAEILDDPEAWDDEAGGWAPVHAAYLLAAMRAPGSLEVVLRALTTAVAHDEPYLIDVADALLAAYGPAGIPTLLGAYADLGPYPRLWVNDALTHIASANSEQRNDVREQLRRVALEDAHPEVRACAAENFLVFATPDDRELLELLVDRRLLDPDSRDDALEGERVSLPPPVDWMRFYDPEAVAERQDEREDLTDLDDDDPFDPGEILPVDPAMSVLSRLDGSAPPPAPLLNAGPKVGRNDPCPCGSGKKFKKCHDV